MTQQYLPGQPIFEMVDGDVVAAGTTIAATPTRALAVREHEVHPYVVWNVDEKGRPSGGRYHSHLADAIEEFDPGE